LRRTLVHLGSGAAFTEAGIEAKVVGGDANNSENFFYEPNCITTIKPSCVAPECKKTKMRALRIA